MLQFIEIIIFQIVGLKCRIHIIVVGIRIIIVGRNGCKNQNGSNISLFQKVKTCFKLLQLLYFEIPFLFWIVDVFVITRYFHISYHTTLLDKI